MTTELRRMAVVLQRTLESFHGSANDLARELVRVLGVNQTDRRALELILLAEEKATTPGFFGRAAGPHCRRHNDSAESTRETGLRQPIAASDRSAPSNRVGHRACCSPYLGIVLPVAQSGRQDVVELLQRPGDCSYRRLPHPCGRTTASAFEPDAWIGPLPSIRVTADVQSCKRHGRHLGTVIVVTGERSCMAASQTVVLDEVPVQLLQCPLLCP